MRLALSAYRQLLRTVDRHITKVNNNRLWRQYIQAEFRSNSELVDPKQAEALIEIAQLYATYVEDVQAHKDLLISYNISVDDEQRRKAHLTNVASKVGLRMPVADEE